MLMRLLRCCVNNTIWLHQIWKLKNLMLKYQTNRSKWCMFHLTCSTCFLSFL
ncbi:hypothetical protein NDU88_005277, partial [Pleurodeles waltl]